MNRLDDFINGKMDAFAASKIEEAIKKGSSAKYDYSVKDLDKQVNSEETLREYLLDGAEEFRLNFPDLDSLSDESLNRLIEQVDDLWTDISRS